ncbi:hypothetical protein J5N97_010859 [Dioscorea zingiberensis]|uniref:Large ribosomal subunit protein uL22c n=1 Tax=Dioscorea zingiberensis TaxID=325984 RepID=A0A9D5D118_9LILI|nr:hypothetical protein J5N97_010859 [Dioscorea zingiberensis]
MPSSRREIQIQGFTPLQPLKVEKDSWKTKKLILKTNHLQPQPLVIYLRSPKIIHVKPQDFMNMVQQLTGKPSFIEAEEARIDHSGDQEQEVRAQGVRPSASLLLFFFLASPGEGLSPQDCPISPSRQACRFVFMEAWRRCLRSVLRQASSSIGRNHQASVASYSTLTKPHPSPTAQALLQKRPYDFASNRIPGPFHQYMQQSGIFSSRYLLAQSATDVVPISSPLIPDLGSGQKTEKKGVAAKPSKVQAIKKDIKQSPKKVNLVAKLVRGMRVEDALLQLQVTVKRAAKTLYQVIHSARANATHNHGLDPDRLLVEEAFVGKGLYLKRLSYHAKGRCGVMVRPRCRLTVVVRETTPEEEAKIAKLRVSNFKKLTRKERQLVPHQLIETTPRWGRKRKENAPA